MHSVKISMSPCRGCGRYVYSAEPFDIIAERMLGSLTTRVVHRACNPAANHSKD